jgi:hypothetical protein
VADLELLTLNLAQMKIESTEHQQTNKPPLLIASVGGSVFSRTQLIILGLCKNYGAEIQVDFENGKYTYTLVESKGDTETIRKDTFNKLKESGQISLKWRPSIDVERWS